MQSNVNVNSYTETDFKDTEIGVIPADWNIAKLRDVVEFTRKPRTLALSNFEAIPFIPMELVPDEGLYAEQYLLKSPAEISSGSYCEEGDLLVAKITPSFENGKQGIVRGLPLKFGYATTEVFPIHPISERLDTLFLFDFLKQPQVRSDIASRMEGTTGRQRVPKLVLENYLIPLPPVPEQRRIAAVLNAIQDEIAVQDDIIAEAREFKRSLMQRLFTYGAGAEPAETRETEVGEIPAHWELIATDDLKSDRKGIVSGPFGSNIGKRFFVDEGVPLIRGNNLTKGERLYVDNGYVFISEAKALELQSCEAVADDIVFTAAGTIGQVGLIPRNGIYRKYIISNKQLRLRVNQQKAVPLYLFYWYSGSAIQRRIQVEQRGTSIPVINLSILRNLPVPLGSLDEQRTIAEQLSLADEKIAAEEDRKTALQDFFKTMLHQLMTGQIRLLSDEGLPL